MMMEEIKSEKDLINFLRKKFNLFLDIKSDNPDDKYVLEEVLTYIYEDTEEAKKTKKEANDYNSKVTELKNSLRQTLD